MFTLGRDRRIVRATQADEALIGRRVADVMVRDPVTVSDDMPLDRFIDDVFLTHRHTADPVLGVHGDVIGLLTVRDVLELPREQWATLVVRDRMHPVGDSLVVDDRRGAHVRGAGRRGHRLHRRHAAQTVQQDGTDTGGNHVG